MILLLSQQWHFNGGTCMNNYFFLVSRRDSYGSCLAFHKLDQLGYTTNIDAALLLTLEEAQEAWNEGREFEHPISADLVRKGSIYRVDFQSIPHVSTKGPDGCAYMAFKRGSTDGNDVFWLNSTSGFCSVDVSKGSKLRYEDVLALSDRYIYLPYDLVDQARRRTFNRGSFNYQHMIKDFGLIKPDHVNSYWG